MIDDNDTEEPPFVTCNCCYKVYDLAILGTKQGYNCASTYYEDKAVIYGHYGSTKYDCVRIELLQKPCNIFDGATVCDNCITSFIDIGIAKISETNFFIDLGDDLELDNL